MPGRAITALRTLKKRKGVAHMSLVILMEGLKKIPSQSIGKAIYSIDRISLLQVYAFLT